MSTIERAIQIAVAGHSGQIDRAGRPYILHPLRVMHKIAKHGDDIMTAAAVLHDVIEDCPPIYTMQIEEEMPARVTFLVRALTHVSGVSYQDYILRLNGDVQAKTIKLADLNDNLFHPARRQGWIGHEKGKQKYLAAWFFLTCGHPM